MALQLLLPDDVHVNAERIVFHKTTDSIVAELKQILDDQGLTSHVRVQPSYITTEWIYRGNVSSPPTVVLRRGLEIRNINDSTWFG